MASLASIFNGTALKSGLADVGAFGNSVLGSISDIKESFGDYIIRPLNAFGIAGFDFDVAGEATAKLSADITDHFTENNVFVQDHISIRPKVFIVKNYVGELVYRESNNNNQPIQKIAQKLTILDNLLPQLTNGAQQIKDALAGQFNNDDLRKIGVNTAADLWGFVKNLTPPVTRQEQAYQFFKALHEQKILVSLETPFEYISNMAIESVVAVQDEDTKYMSSFTITLKQIRTVSTRTIPFDSAQYQNNASYQHETEVNNGSTLGLPFGEGADSTGEAANAQKTTTFLLGLGKSVGIAK